MLPDPPVLFQLSIELLHILRCHQRHLLASKLWLDVVFDAASIPRKGAGADGVLFILLSFSSSEKPQKRRKRSHTNVSNTLVARSSTPPAQTPQRSFRGTAAGIHTCLRQQDRTQRLTGRNRGVSGGGAITTLGAFCAVRKPCAAGCQNGILCRFWTLVECAPEERKEPAGQRCAHARRCPEASRPRWAA